MWPFTEIEKQLRRLAMKQTKPAGVRYSLKRRSDAMLIYSVSVAPAVDHDVVSRTLTVTVNGTTREPQTFAPDATNLGTHAFADSDEVTMTLVDIDDNSNASEPAVLSFVATDTIPPAKPGEFGVTLIDEEA